MAGMEVSNAVVEACRLLSSEEPIRSRDVARAVGLSAAYFQRCFKKQLGITPQQYRRRVIAERGRNVLGRSRSVTESIYEAGYSSSSRFYEGLGRELGMRPSVARAGGTGETIQYAVARCSLGQLMVAWTERGVCEVAFDDSKKILICRLQQRFPGAALQAAGRHDWVSAVIDAVEHAASVNIPLDIRGTAFQERVWQALRAIPVGEKRTYSDVAQAVGRPKATRAVARACAENVLAVLVPCHRVVGKNGSLVGYRWGIERKRELLRREVETTNSQLEKP